MASTVTEQGGRLAAAERDLSHMADDQERMHKETTTALGKVAEGLADLRDTVVKHIQDDRVSKASWALWEKVVLALLTTLAAPVVTLVLAKLLASGGHPAVETAAQALEALGK